MCIYMKMVELLSADFPAPPPPTSSVSYPVYSKRGAKKPTYTYTSRLSSTKGLSVQCIPSLYQLPL